MEQETEQVIWGYCAQKRPPKQSRPANIQTNKQVTNIWIFNLFYQWVYNPWPLTQETSEFRPPLNAHWSEYIHLLPKALHALGVCGRRVMVGIRTLGIGHWESGISAKARGRFDRPRCWTGFVARTSAVNQYTCWNFPNKYSKQYLTANGEQSFFAFPRIDKKSWWVKTLRKDDFIKHWTPFESWCITSTPSKLKLVPGRWQMANTEGFSVRNQWRKFGLQTGKWVGT